MTSTYMIKNRHKVIKTIEPITQLLKDRFPEKYKAVQKAKKRFKQWCKRHEVAITLTVIALFIALIIIEIIFTGQATMSSSGAAIAIGLV